MSETELAFNKRALHEYEIIETFEAGIQLLGTEVKSLRDRGGSLLEAYVKPMGADLLLINFSIAPYKHGNINNHEEKRARKLLLHKKEIAYLARAIQQKGLTVIPLALYLKGSLIKLKIALVRGKKSYDKRQVLKEREEKRYQDRMMKNVKNQ